MKFDKETIIVLVIAGLIMAGWFIFYPQYQNEQAEKAKQQQLTLQQNRAQQQLEQQQQQLREQAVAQQQTQTPAAAKETPAAPATPAAPEATEKTTKPVEEPKQEKPLVVPSAILENDLVKFTFDPYTGTLISAELKAYKKNVDSKEGDNLILKPALKKERSFYAGEILSADAIQPPVWKRSGETLTISRQLPSCKVEESFTLKPGTYTLNVDYKVINTSNAPLPLKDLTFWAAGMPPIQALSDDEINTDRHYIDFSLANGDTDWFTPDFSEDSELHDDYVTNMPAKWMGSTNKYFASLLFSDTGFKGGLRFNQNQTLVKNGKVTIPTVGGSVADTTLEPGHVVSFKMQYYCGPKELARVEKLDETAADAMHIAYWSWFEFIARPIARFLVWLGKLIGNYGIAIILLTLLVRALLWPLVQKSNNSMRKMQKIQPKMKELREKYKDNQQELSMRMMELYRTEGVNPLGGCLPMLLQIPIFFAMYSVFDSAVELRHVSFLWAKDLAQPDAIGPAIFGLQLHPLIILMTVLMVLQQKMTPSQMEPMQQKIMMAVPIIMLVMLYWLPSGLTLYWTISQVVSIIQLKVSQKIAEKEDAAGQSSTKTAKAK